MPAVSVPTSSRRGALTVALALLALVLLPGTPPAAQTGGLQDGQVVVVTSDGLFLVGPDPVTQQLLTAADFGLASLCAPSVTWIDQTSTLVVTSTRDCGGASQLFRVRVHPGPSASVTEVAVPGLSGGAPVDAVYDPARDRLWLLDGQAARVYAWDQPVTAPGSALELVHQLDVDDPTDLALYGVAEPGALLVAQRHLLQKLLPDGSSETLWSWEGVGLLTPPEDVSVHGLQDEVYVLRPGLHGVDILMSPELVVPLNKWPDASCNQPVALDPADLDWDYDSKRLWVLAARGVSCFQGGALVDEPNHVVGLRRLVPLGGGGNPLPVLLTPTPSSGISGTDPDLAHLRFWRPGLIHQGQATAPAGSSPPTSLTAAPLGKLEPGEDLLLRVSEATPGTPAWLVAGLSEQPLVIKGAQVLPALDLVLASATDAQGQAQLVTTVPADPVFSGLELRTQWLVTPPGEGASATWATWIRLAD